MGSLIRNLFMAIIAVGGLVIGGALIFSYIEGLNIFDSFYHIVLSITTVGSSYIPQLMAGKVFTMLVIVFGMGLVLYLVMLLARILIEGQFTMLMQSIRGGFTKMKKMKNHTIVCGYGKLGKYAAKTLHEKKEDYVIIENNHQKVTDMISKRLHVIEGDSLDPVILKNANIKDAKAVISTLANDADNLYLLMTAKDLNPNALLASKATSEEAVERLHKMGAQIVVLPEIVGGKQIVEALLEVGKAEDLTTISKKKKK